MNITELARKLKVDPKELREKLPQLGFDIGKKAIQIDDQVAKKVIVLWPEFIKKTEEESGIISEVEEKKEEETKTIFIPSFITVHQFAEKLNLPVTKVIKELMKNQIIATINERIDFETAAIIGEDLGFKIKRAEEEEEKEREKEKKEKFENLLKEKLKKAKNLIQRPPIIVVMGHVDHGKTLLLDTIRKTNIVQQEEGGITQHIGAYQVKQRGKIITFIDTPGHEAFKSLRARGGMVSDIAILVIAADDHIQPQTLEAIKIIQEEQLPFIVAINKIDKEEADIEKIKKELAEINLVPEDWGGEVICVPVSAKTGQGIENLLEMILLVADLHKDKFTTTSEGEAIGTIIESKIDPTAGPVATVLVHSGTLKIGDSVIVGNSYGKIRAMKNWQGKPIEEAPPSTPVRFLGFKSLPEAGDILEVVNDQKEFKKRIRELEKTKEISLSSFASLETKKIKKEEKEEKITLNIILRADVLGSLESIVHSLGKIKLKKGKIKVIKQGLGNITEADVLFAEASKAIIIGFRVKANPNLVLAAKNRNVEIKTFQVIYELLDFCQKELTKLIPPEIVRKKLGEVKILAIFRSEPNSMIVGGKVIEGKIRKGTKAEIKREEQIIGRGEIEEVQVNKVETQEVEEGKECGIKFKGKPLIKIGDILQVYLEEKKTIDNI